MPRWLQVAAPTILLLVGLLIGAAMTLYAAQQGALAPFGVVDAASVSDEPVAAEGAAIEPASADEPVTTSFGRTIRLLQDARAKIRGPSKVIYLNREGATLLPGADDAANNRSSIVKNAGFKRMVMPGYSGSDRGWQALARCIEQRFAPFGVQVTDRRPVGNDDYIMAVVGGSARELGYDAKEAKGIGGLAPFNGSPIGGAVVFVFTATLKNRLEDSCDTAAMEIAHAYGLDHSFHCRDVMTYKKRCGARRFVDEDMRCGEDEPRDCTGGAKTQNSHQRLLAVLGPRQGQPGPEVSERDPDAPRGPAGSAGPAGDGHDHQH